MADDAGLFAWRLRADFDARFQPVDFAVFQRKQIDISAAAAEESTEHARLTREGFAHAFKGLLEARAACFVEFGDERFETCLRAIDVDQLLRERFVAHFELTEFINRIEIHIAKLANDLAQLVGF